MIQIRPHMRLLLTGIHTTGIVSVFFKSQFGAYIGDMYMSLIHTCNLMRVNPFDYLVALQKSSAEVARSPSQWMPWNFKKAMALPEA